MMRGPKSSLCSEVTMQRRSESFPLALAASLLAAAACKQSTPEKSSTTAAASLPDKIVIGATLPLTGAEARIGGFYKEGYELAFEEANKAGGILVGGKRIPVALQLLDDTTTQATAVSLADRLINVDKVNFLLGTYSTALVQAQSSAAEQNRIPYVNGGGAATEIYQQGYKWIFGLLAPVELLADAIMQWLDMQQKSGKLPKPSIVAVVWENTSHGKDFRKGVSEFAKSHPGDYQVAVDESFELNAKDFSALLNAVKAAKADLLLVDAHLPDYITMQRQYVTAGMCNKVLSYGARGSEKQAADALGQKNVNYVLSAVWWNSQLGSKGLNKHFVDIFRTKYNRQPEWYQALGYETARVLFAAIEQANSVDREAVRAKLASMEIESILPGGKLRFPADKGQQAHNPFVVQQNVPDGSAPIVYPLDVANAPGVVPRPDCKG
jgi:branched-chain amino acid transport system substrate-binding protein